jgi:hypothetical protein
MLDELLMSLGVLRAYFIFTQKGVRWHNMFRGRRP